METNMDVTLITDETADLRCADRCGCGPSCACGDSCSCSSCDGRSDRE